MYTAQDGGYSPVTVTVPQTTVEALSVTANGTYTAESGKAYSPVTVSVGNSMTILVTAPAGSTVTATKDGVTYTGVEDAQNPGSFTVTVTGGYGTYTVTATDGSWSKSGTVTLTPEAIVFAKLPAEYTELQYLQGNGSTSYIDTNLTVSIGATYMCTFACGEDRSDNVSHSIATVATTNGVVGYNVEYENGTIYAAMIKVGGGSSYAEIPVDGNFHSAQCSATLQKIDMVEVQTNVSGSPSGSHIYLFAANSYNGRNKYSTGKIASFSVYENDVLTSEMIPARRNSDSVLGMYDTVRQQFFTNAGTGDFIAGPDVA